MAGYGRSLEKQALNNNYFFFNVNQSEVAFVFGGNNLYNRQVRDELERQYGPGHNPDNPPPIEPGDKYIKIGTSIGGIAGGILGGLIGFIINWHFITILFSIIAGMVIGGILGAIVGILIKKYISRKGGKKWQEKQ